MDYKVISAFTPWGLSRKVKKLYQKGYKPQGGVFKAMTSFYQALIKYEEN